MRITILFTIFVLLSAFTPSERDLTEINTLLDKWHVSAANADFDQYFRAVTDDFVFLGTDPKERWTKAEFEAFCRPYFSTGKAWNFIPSDRHVIFSKDGKTAWFDERLDTWMRECRGSGVAVKTKSGWKLAYYNLTVLIENEKVKSFIELRDRQSPDQ